MIGKHFPELSVDVQFECPDSSREVWKCVAPGTKDHCEIIFYEQREFYVRSSLAYLGNTYSSIERAACVAADYLRLIVLTVDNTIVSRKLTAEALATLSRYYSTVINRNRNGVAVLRCGQGRHSAELLGCDDGSVNLDMFLNSELVAAHSVPKLDLAIECTHQWLRDHHDPIASGGQACKPRKSDNKAVNRSTHSRGN